MTSFTLGTCSTWLERRFVWFGERVAATTSKTKRCPWRSHTFSRSSQNRPERFPRSFGNGMASIPWAAIIGLRHRVVHDYLHVDLDLVWEVVHQDLKSLVTKLEQVVPD